MSKSKVSNKPLNLVQTEDNIKHCFLTKNGVSILIPTISNQIIPLKKLLTIKIPREVPGQRTYIEERKNYIQKGKYIYIPRFRAIRMGITYDNKLRDIETNNMINYNYLGEPLEYQVHIIENIMNIFTDENKKLGKCGVVVKAGTGIGKTYIAFSIIAKLKVKTLIVLPQVALLKQWEKDLKILFPDEEIGKYYGGVKKICNITLAVVNSLLLDYYVDDRIDNTANKSDKSADNTADKSTDNKPNNKKAKGNIDETNFFKNFDFVIFDEIHMYQGRKKCDIFNKTQCSYMMGLSASMIRERVEMYDYIVDRVGDVFDVDSLESVRQTKIKFTSEAHIINYVGAPIFTTPVLINDTVNYFATAGRLAADNRRNLLIIDEIMNLLNHNIFVLTIFRDHVLELYRLLYDRIDGMEKSENIEIIAPELSEEEITDIQEKYKIKTDDITSLMGGASSKELEYGITRKIIISTYDYSGTGISIDSMTALIVALPIKHKMFQVIGRIFRANKSYAHITRIIIDILDQRSPLKNQFKVRRLDYDNRECVMIHR